MSYQEVGVRFSMVVASFLFAVFGTELVLRATGHQPSVPLKYSFVVDPKMCFARNYLGTGLVPGKFEVNINDGLIYRATHTNDSTRITSFETDSIPRDTLLMFGCSYTYGMAVNDEETYPFLVQAARKDLTVLNYAVPGYGSLQGYIILQRLISAGSRPKIVVVNYADFHEERDLLAPSYLAKLQAGAQSFHLDSKTMNYPRVVFNDGTISFETVNVFSDFHPLPLTRTLALANLLNVSLIKMLSREVLSLTASKTIIMGIQNVCQENNIQLIVTQVDRTFNESSIAEFCEVNHINFVDISPDFSTGEYRSLPKDFHPNAKAHQVYSAKFVNYLNSVESND